MGEEHTPDCDRYCGRLDEAKDKIVVLEAEIKLRSESEKIWVERFGKLQAETVGAYNRGYIKGLAEGRE